MNKKKLAARLSKSFVSRGKFGRKVNVQHKMRKVRSHNRWGTRLNGRTFRKWMDLGKKDLL